MAQKRMLAKSITLSKKIARLSLKSALIYTWCIPFLDDYGLITREPEGMKAEVFCRRKEISEKDILNFIKEASMADEEGDVLITEYKDCLKFNHFEDYQSITSEKRVKSKFSKIPKIPQENIGENNISQESPVQESIGEDRLSKDRIVVAANGSSPSEISQRFFSEDSNSEQEAIIATLVFNGMPEQLARAEITKFVSYWTERSKNGLKQRWEGQKFFDLKRRLGTWFRNAKEWDTQKAGNKKIAWL